MNKAKDEKSELYGYGGQLSGILLFLLLFLFYFILFLLFIFFIMTFFSYLKSKIPNSNTSILTNRSNGIVV